MLSLVCHSNNGDIMREGVDFVVFVVLKNPVLALEGCGLLLRH